MKIENIRKAVELTGQNIISGKESQGITILGKGYSHYISNEAKIHVMRLCYLQYPSPRNDNIRLFDQHYTPLVESLDMRNVTVENLVATADPWTNILTFGQVYEELLCFKGYIAEDDLFEVKPALDRANAKKRGYLITKNDLHKYLDEEKTDMHGELICHKRGNFIFNRFGRLRETMAAFYTPQSLTSCLVKYALKVLMKSRAPDEILEMKVCEPSVGSGNFLVEAVNQMSNIYLSGPNTAHLTPAETKQRITDNCYGVDLDPGTKDIVEAQLQLNVGALPVSPKIIIGNSLIGARRQVFTTEQVASKSRDWLTSTPIRIKPGETRPPGTIYHFLLPDKGMCAYRDNVINQLVPEHIAKIKTWRKEFFKPFTKDQILLLQQMSDRIDVIWGDIRAAGSGLKKKM